MNFETETMNKLLMHFLSRFLLLIVPALSSGCTQSPIIDSSISTPTNTPQSSQTSTLVTTAATLISIPCVSSSQTPASDIEKIAEEWFQSSQISILNRDQYQTNTGWENFCQTYQDAHLNGDSWIAYPTEIALRFSGYPNADNFPPAAVTTIFKRGDPRITTVVVLFTNLLDDSVRDVETRVDLINENDQWQVQWSGYRLRCYRNNTDEWVKTPCP